MKINPCPYLHTSKWLQEKEKPPTIIELIDKNADTDTLYVVMCKECGACGPWAINKQDAIIGWNSYDFAETRDSDDVFDPLNGTIRAWGLALAIGLAIWVAVSWWLWTATRP